MAKQVDNKNVFPANKLDTKELSDKPERKVKNNTKGTSRINGNIEIEKDEVILTPDMKVFKAKGNTHANGGIPYFAEGGEFIYSNQIKMKGKDIKNFFTQNKFAQIAPELQTKMLANIKEDGKIDLSGLKVSDNKEYSIADIASKFMTNDDLDRLGDDNAPSKVATKTSSMYNLQSKTKQLSLLSNLQELYKAKDEQQKFAKGGMVKFGPGGGVRKVDKAPDGYAFSHEEDGKKYYTKSGANGQLAIAQGNGKQGGAQYEQFLQQQLASGVSPDELVAKKYIAPDKASMYAGYYKPNMDTVYTEQGAVKPSLNDTPAYAGRGQAIYLPNKHIAGEIYYNSRNSSGVKDDGTLNTAPESAHIKFRDDFNYSGEEVDVQGADLQKYLGTSHTFPTGDLYNELKSKSKITKLAKGGALPKAEFGMPPDRSGKWAYDKINKNGKKKGWNGMTDFGGVQEYANAVGYEGNAWDIKGMQKWVGQNYPDLVAKYHSKDMYGMPAAGNPYDGKLGVRWNDIGKEIMKGDNPQSFDRINPETAMPDQPDYEMPTLDPNHRLTTPEMPEAVKDPVRPDGRFSDMDYMSMFAALTTPVNKYRPIRQQVRFTPNRWDNQDLTAQRQMIKGQVSEAQYAQSMFAGPQQQAASIGSFLQGQAMDGLNNSYMGEHETNRVGQMQIDMGNNAGQDDAYNKNQALTGVYHDQESALNQNVDEFKARRKQQILLAYQNAVRNKDTRQLLNQLTPNYQIGRNFDVNFQSNPDIFNQLIARGQVGSAGYAQPISFDKYKSQAHIGLMSPDEQGKAYENYLKSYRGSTGDINGDGMPDVPRGRSR